MDLRKTIYKIARCGIAMAVIAAFASEPLDAKDNFSNAAHRLSRNFSLAASKMMPTRPNVGKRMKM